MPQFPTSSECLGDPAIDVMRLIRVHSEHGAKIFSRKTFSRSRPPHLIVDHISVNIWGVETLGVSFYIQKVFSTKGSLK